MIFAPNTRSRSFHCAYLCVAVVILYSGLVASLEVPHEAKASIAGSDSASNETLLASSEGNNSSFTFGALNTPHAAFASANNQLGNQQTSLQSTSDVSSSTQSQDAKTPKEIHKDAQKRATYTKGDTPVMTKRDKREILWLARIVYSETKRPHEQRLVAWVVRNRVDTGYTGRTYERVANHSAQFSGLQPSDPRYEHNMSRWWASGGESWKSALEIAKEVYFAPESDRPFSVTTRHFYSPVAVSKPDWARGREAVRVVNGSRAHAPRFAFYARVR